MPDLPARAELLGLRDRGGRPRPVGVRPRRWLPGTPSDDFRVRVVRAAGGLADGRNRGAAVAVGEFLAFVDADDAVTRHGFAMTITALRESGSDVAVAAHRPTRRGHAFPVADRVRAAAQRPSPPHLGRRLPRPAGRHRDRRPGVPPSRVRRPRLVLSRPREPRRRPQRRCLPAGLRRRHPHPRRAAAPGGARPRDRSPGVRRTSAGLRDFGAGVEAAADTLPEPLAAVYAAEVLAGSAEPFLDRAWRCPDDYWATLRDVVDLPTRHGRRGS